VTHCFDDWSDARRLVQTLGSRNTQTNGEGNDCFGICDVQPVIQVNLPALPQPTLDELNLAYHRGADAHKRATEKAVLMGIKFSEKQLIHLLAFCGLRPGV